MDKLKRGDSLQQLIDTINEIIDVLGSAAQLENVLGRNPIDPIKVYTSDTNTNVSGEVHRIASSGQYKISSVGAGLTRIVIINGVTNSKIEDFTIRDTSESKSYFLSGGDKIMFYVSSTSVSTLVTSLYMTGTFYTMITETFKDFYDLRAEVSEVIHQNSVIINNQQNIIDQGSEIAGHYLLQISAVQTDYIGLNNRVTTLEGK